VARLAYIGRFAPRALRVLGVLCAKSLVLIAEVAEKFLAEDAEQQVALKLSHYQNIAFVGGAAAPC